jgi:hypothetical protein
VPGSLLKITRDTKDKKDPGDYDKRSFFSSKPFPTFGAYLLFPGDIV